MNTRIRSAWGRGGVAAAAVALVGASVALAAGTPGTLDTTFGGGTGVVTTAGVWSILDAAVQPAGASERYLVAGQAASSKPAGSINGDWVVLGYSPAGALDSTFGAGGNGVVRLFPSDPNATIAYDLSLDDQNRVVVGGTSTARSVTTYDRKGVPTTVSYRGMTVVRLTASGQLDTAFNGTGVASVWAGSPDGYNEVGVAAAAVPDALGGGIVAAGTCFYVQTAATKKSAAVINRRLFLAKFKNDGTLDTAFGTGGFAFDPRSSEPRPVALALQSDGRIVVGEHTEITPGTNTAANNWVVSRFTAAGALDTSFGASGRVMLSGAYLHQLRVNPADNSIVAGGGGLVVRYLSTGATDTTFDGDGVATVAGGTAQPSLAVQSDGRVVFCGQTGSPSYGIVGRLDGAGAPDGSFGTGGYAAALPTGWWPQCAAEAADGIVVAGSAGSGSNQIFVARYGK